ncbi:MAG: DUF1326 domain-containing protein [Bryobacterales bacterium]|nr:DUF1326 domain-containing protein [Bryobacteraceae bacterium]MDW8354341.1 DUF1326 domain-containing protein [Bryobacterales bacterium]
MKSATVLFTLLVLAGAALFAAPPAAVVTGDYVEVRSGHVYTCGCLYSGEMATGGREALLTWAVREGNYRGVALGGAKAVAMILGGAHLGLPETERKSVLFVDAAGPQQQEALVDLLRDRYGRVLGRIVDVHRLPISMVREQERLTVSVGSVARFVVRPARLPEDAHLGSSLWYEPFIPTVDRTLATAEYSRFWGDDFQHRWWNQEPGIYGYIARFRVP